jgi:hypothetical protein
MKLEQLSIPRLVELNSGVDALYCSSRNPIPNKFFELLLSFKAKAGEDDLGLASFDLEGIPFEVSSRSWGKYPICISHEFGQVGFSLSKKLPNIRLQVRAKYLHSVGPNKALDWFSDVLKKVAIYPFWTPSRMDLFADFQGWNPTAEDKERIVMRASNLKMNEERNVFTGFEIGRRKTGTINARIYDKTRELESKPNGWSRHQWGVLYEPNLPVWRFEYEFHATFFREVGILTTEQALNKLDELWAYANDLWFTVREVGDDLNKSRWPISNEWEQVQKASLRGSAVPIERIRETEQKLSLERLIPGFHGYLTSIGAKLGATNLTSCLELAGEVLRLAEERGKISTVEKLALKKRKFAL